MPVTLKSIALRADVSPATVCLALNNDPRVAETTREKVKKLAAELGYVPSNLGRALQSRKSRLIGYLLSDATTSFYSELLQAIGEVATHNNYGLLVAVTEDSPKAQERQLALFKEKNVEGIILSSWTHDLEPPLSDMNQQGTPVVVCSGRSFSKDIPFVITDNRHGGRIASEYLLSLGHRRMAFCFGRENSDRFEGCRDTARAKDLPSPVICTSPEKLAEILKGPNRPTAVVANSDLSALDVKHVAEDLGLAIPKDLSVIGFDDMWFTALPEFRLTTLSQSKKEIGRLAAEMLLRRIAGEKPEDIFLEPQLIIRESCAPNPE